MSRLRPSSVTPSSIARPSAGSGVRSTRPRSTRCWTWRLIAPLSMPNSSTIADARRGRARRARRHEVRRRLQVFVHLAGALPITRLIRRIRTPSPLELVEQLRGLPVGHRSALPSVTSSGATRCDGLVLSARWCVRSGTSLMNRTQTKATTRTGPRSGTGGRSPRRTRPSKTARTGAGSVARSGIEWLLWPPGDARATASPSVTLCGDLVAEHGTERARPRSSRPSSGRTRRPSWPHPCRPVRCCSGRRARGSASWRRARARARP